MEPICYLGQDILLKKNLIYYNIAKKSKAKHLLVFISEPKYLSANIQKIYCVY